MSRLVNTSSFKEIPNALDEDLKCSIVLALQDGGRRKYHERENNYFPISLEVGKRLSFEIASSAGSDEDASSFDLEAPQIHYSSNPCIILELRCLVIFCRIYNDLVIVHH
ncbi:hypothetical protein CEXT_616251 [Caerostris extrusa]|uniref:Uncharacterized protein n=1 Tax=Caerostris extrusa TaxID=172846 RepID=A0AAV4NUF0_CAEEX|nr:hypothetical protein CEXT_616251 [Caerostris extrusa]